MIWIIIPWLCWMAYRVALTKSKSFKFNFNEWHHSDAGWAFFMQGCTLQFNWWLIAFGLILALDDAAGHWRSAHGKPETFILEWMFGWLIRWFYRLIRK